jgi:hypothetical protein
LGLGSKFLAAAEQVAMLVSERDTRKRARSWLLDATPDSDGHPVLMESGFILGAWSLGPTEELFRDKGYPTYNMPGIVNMSFDNQKFTATVNMLKRITDKHGKRATLLAYSAGGFGPGLAAVQHPELVENMTMFATPVNFTAPGAVSAPVSSAFRAFNLRTWREEKEIAKRLLHSQDDVPRTMIVPDLDIIIGRSGMRGIRGRKTESVLIHGTHFSFNSAVAQLIMLDRSAEKRDTWRIFDEDRYSNSIFPRPRVIQHLSLVA